MAQTPIRWLHLSDFHFQALERWDRRKTLQALLRHVEKLRDEGPRPDFVFVTGDVGFSGKPKEYDQAVLFFTALAEKLELEPRERFFFVPGNYPGGKYDKTYLAADVIARGPTSRCRSSSCRCDWRRGTKRRRAGRRRSSSTIFSTNRRTASVRRTSPCSAIPEAARPRSAASLPW
jgi:hypothetical protein